MVIDEIKMTTALLTDQATGTIVVRSASVSIGGYCVHAQGTVQCEKCGRACANTTFLQNNGGLCDSCEWIRPFCDMWSELAEQASTEQASTEQSSADQLIANRMTMATNIDSGGTLYEEDDMYRNELRAERQPEVP